MREIKFRGKIPETNEWVYGCYWTNGLGNHFIRGYLENDQFVLRDYEVAPETIGQYTGLDDRNYKEVYEGDILKVFLGNGKEKIKTVVFESGMFKCSGIWEGGNTISLCSIHGDFRAEVIGNIYENPELLEG